ncbi:MAG: molybdenum cofactor guanylyltransferase [Gemmatimonadaceae bacterium]
MSRSAHCTGAILAGGRATRFRGVAKGLESVGGVRMIDCVAAVLRDSCDDLVIVANDAAAAGWIPGTRTIADVRTGAGPLGGIHAALTSAHDAVLALSWDSPFVPAPLMRALRDAGEHANADAAVPSSHSLWGFEPLCAWYRTSCLPAIEHRIDAGELRAAGWQGDVNTVHVDASPWGDPDEIFFSVNSAADLAMANIRIARAP